MIAAEHHEHAASVEGYGIEGDGDSMSYVPTTQFQYPEDGEPEKPVVRDQWRSEPIYRKCQRRFAPVKSGDVMTMPLLDTIASGLRANEATIVSSDDVAKIVKIWSPNDGAQWQQLAGQLGGVAGQALQSTGQTKSAAIVENIATGLNNAAAAARTTTP